MAEISVYTTLQILVKDIKLVANESPESGKWQGGVYFIDVDKKPKMLFATDYNYNSREETISALESMIKEIKEKAGQGYVLVRCRICNEHGKVENPSFESCRDEDDHDCSNCPFDKESCNLGEFIDCDNCQGQKEIKYHFKDWEVEFPTI